MLDLLTVQFGVSGTESEDVQQSVTDSMLIPESKLVLSSGQVSLPRTVPALSKTDGSREVVVVSSSGMGSLSHGIRTRQAFVPIMEAGQHVSSVNIVTQPLVSVHNTYFCVHICVKKFGDVWTLIV